MSKLLGRVQILDFLLHLLKALAQWRVLSKLSFHPCILLIALHVYMYELQPCLTRGWEQLTRQFSITCCYTNTYGHSTIFFHHRAQGSSNLPIRHPRFGYEIIVQWYERFWIGHVGHFYWSWFVCLLPFLQCHTSDIHCQEIHETLQDMKEQLNNTNKSKCLSYILLLLLSLAKYIWNKVDGY